MNKRLIAALAAFAALGVIGAFTLHGQVLGLLVIVLAYFAIRSVIADRIQAQREAEAKAAEAKSAEESAQPEPDQQESN